MKILFICGSLEPGCDGVGDYVHRLSHELLKEGQHVSAIAFHDHHISKFSFVRQFVEGESLTILRLPSIWKANQRFARVEQWINEFNPDWLSLQFVPFSFHKKGLPYTLAKQLSSLSQGRKWHIMFHELWVGMEREAPLKYRVLGKAQQLLIKSLIRQLRPRTIHTQTHLYQVQLAKLGATVHQLPLFGNIPFIDNATTNRSFNSISVQKPISFLLFGNIHHSDFVQRFTDEAAAYKSDTGTPLSLTLIGRCGPESEYWISAWNAAGLDVEMLGEQSPTAISAALQKATFGLATTPTALIEKSGTAAAMQEHGLRIICVGRAWHPRTDFTLRQPANIAIYTPGNFKDCVLPGILPVSNENTVSFIAERLLSHLISNN
ncbi:hypothetical protein [Hymenobacter norwichensis]|uniref:hypothetical protein n=1 Tax=Hymenobacter norwichensis TaxID=223903 RepID=UPI00041DFCD6|nr:hypothetical protein [Hymenobacter norwichensis]